jgi:hypothetical protein
VCKDEDAVDVAARQARAHTHQRNVLTREKKEKRKKKQSEEEHAE